MTMKNICVQVRGAADDVSAGTNCKKCEAACARPRPPGCPHPCSIGSCHAGPCPECVTTVKLKCHCGLANKFVRCGELLAADPGTREQLLCCGDQCPQLMECGHRCSLTCHTGPCSRPEDCKKKVKVSCKCKKKKEEFRCFQAFKQGSLVQCDSDCVKANKGTDMESKTAVKESEEDIRNRKEAELFERQMQGGKKKRRPRTESTREEKQSLLTKKSVLVVSVAVGVISLFTYFAFTLE